MAGGLWEQHHSPAGGEQQRAGELRQVRVVLGSAAVAVDAAWARRGHPWGPDSEQGRAGEQTGQRERRRRAPCRIPEGRQGGSDTLALAPAEIPTELRRQGLTWSLILAPQQRAFILAARGADSVV